MKSSEVVTIVYQGGSYIRSVSRADLHSRGLDGPDLVWEQANMFRVEVPLDVALFLLTEEGFSTTEGESFGDLLRQVLK